MAQFFVLHRWERAPRLSHAGKSLSMLLESFSCGPRTCQAGHTPWLLTGKCRSDAQTHHGSTVSSFWWFCALCFLTLPSRTPSPWASRSLRTKHPRAATTTRALTHPYQESTSGTRLNTVKRRTQLSHQQRAQPPRR